MLRKGGKGEKRRTGVVGRGEGGGDDGDGKGEAKPRRG